MYVSEARLITNATVSDVTITSLQVTWTSVDDLGIYMISYYPDQRQTEARNVINIFDHSYKLTNLWPATNYTISVRVNNSISDIFTISAVTGNTIMHKQVLTVTGNTIMHIQVLTVATQVLAFASPLLSTAHT